jgi:uncharacterized protein YcbK (DUF882 family)
MRTRIIALIISLSLTTILIPGSLPAASQLRGDGTITFYRPDKNERATIHYRDASGKYSTEAMKAIAHLFRCRLTGEEHEIDPALIEKLDTIEDHFRAGEIRLISTYRSPLRNALMRRHSRGVAKESLHMRGMAADIEIERISKTSVRDFAYSLHDGGVGFYRRSGFVHVDSGAARAWGWNPKPYSRTSPAAAFK